MTHLFALLIAGLFISLRANSTAQEIERIRCWKYENFRFNDEQRIIVEDAYLSFMKNGEVQFHGYYDSNLQTNAFRNTFILLDSVDSRVAVVVIEYSVGCGVDEIKSRLVSYKRYSQNPTKSVSWKGWEVDDMRKCSEEE